MTSSLNEFDRHPATDLITICDRGGRTLAVARPCPPAGDLRLTIDRVLSGKGVLLSYFFGRGLRDVAVHVGMLRLKGRLSTRWTDTERLWFVDLQPLPDFPHGSSGIRASRAGHSLAPGDEGVA